MKTPKQIDALVTVQLSQNVKAFKVLSDMAIRLEAYRKKNGENAEYNARRAELYLLIEVLKQSQTVTTAIVNEYCFAFRQAMKTPDLPGQRPEPPAVA